MSNDPLIGRRLGNFKIERLLGRGGMATVYYGRDVKLQRPVAIKVLDARYQGNPAYARRFVREAQMVATWRHENIVQIYYADEQDGLFYFVMEYVDGPDLGKLMSDYSRRRQRMPVDEVVRIGRAVANALDYAHQKKVVHRDVKPSNVMLTSDSRVMLTDFGLALDVQQGTLGEVFGSAHYIAPEQARNSSGAVPQSDLYSLGVILYEMLTGTVPFDDPSPISVSLQHMTTPPPPPRKLNPRIGPETEAVLLKALSKAPRDRYQTGRALLDALETTLQDKPAGRRKTEPGKPVPPGEKPPAGAGLKRLVIGGILLLFLLVLGGIWIKWGKDISSLIGMSPLSPLPKTASPATPDARFKKRIYMPFILNSPSPTPTEVIAPTPRRDGRRFMLFYNKNGFYIFNDSGKDSQIAPIAFERLGSDGQPQNRFDGWRWSRYYSFIRNGKCVSAEVRGGTFDRPAECSSYSSQITVSSGDDSVFWLETVGSTDFQVLWNGEVVGRCEIAAGECEVFLP
ncbi:MAG: serine/threonine protein kinase [Anaerolineae bacterium]|nr:serine/threonine protein kinase [Anaerolineae bacterium]